MRGSGQRPDGIAWTIGLTAEVAGTLAVHKIFRDLGYKQEMHCTILLHFEKDLDSQAAGK